MFEEAADCGASTVAGGRRVLTSGFDVIEEARDCVGIQIAQFQRGDTTTQALRDKLEQKLQRIPVGTHRVHACAALARQILDEERLDQREQCSRRDRAHRGRRERRRCCSNRPLASSSNSGVALR